jgi:hypothetical protein
MKDRRLAMKHNRNIRWINIALWGMGTVAFIMACSLSPSLISTPTPTITGGGSDPPQPSSNRCEGLSGELEMHVLVGPSEVVGLEPLAVGNIPFSVVSGEGANIVQGSGSISYQNVLEEDWGTYTVYFELETIVSGECKEGEQSGMLYITMEMSGEQLVEVRAEEFQGDYPWSGSHEFNLSFPIAEGATAEGEGWAFVLYMND